MKIFRKLSHASRRIPSWLPTALVVALILWLTLAPDPAAGVKIPLFPGADKLVHICMFWGLAMVGWFDAGRRHGAWHCPSPGVEIACAAGALALGIGIEFAQEAMELGRGFEWADMGADAIGAALALMLMQICRHRERTN